MAAAVSSSAEKIPRRQQILEALAQMLEAPAETRVTTAALASQVGVSEAALYRHFPSKTRMFEGLIEFAEKALLSRIHAIREQESSARECCNRILLLVLTFAERNRGISRVLTGEALSGESERLYKRVTQLFERIETELRQVLREGEIHEGFTTHPATSGAVELMLAAVEGKIRQFVRSGFSRSPTAAWQEQWQALEAGIFRQT